MTADTNATTYIIETNGQIRARTPEETQAAMAQAQAPWDLYEQGVKLMCRGEFRKAETSLEAAIVLTFQLTSDSTPGQFLIRLSQAYWLDGKKEMAWQAVCAISDDDFKLDQRARNAFNYVLVRRGFQSATVAAEAIADRKKNDVEVAAEFRQYGGSMVDSKIATALAMTGDLIASGDDDVIAISYCREILASEPENAPTLFNLGFLLERAHKYPEAILALQKAQALFHSASFKQESFRRAEWLKKKIS